MMGRHEKQNELWVEPVNLARRIPEDHPLRRLNRVLELDFVRQEVAGCYGRNGQVSVDPVIIMKMMLLLFWDDVSSERELVRVIPLRIDYLWFLGYGLEDEVPNHSVLSKARKRWGRDVFERLFSRTVQQCLDAGLIDGSKLHVDSSLVRADASLNSVVRITLNKLEEAGEEEGKAPVNDTFRSGTDPESTLVRHQTGKSLPSYKNHRVLDDKAGVITALQTTTGIVNEAHPLEELVDAHRENTGREPGVVVADSKYGNTENMIMLARRKIRCHAADLRSKQANHREQGIYPSSRFRYDKATDSYRCPAGRTLHAHHYAAGRGYTEYRTKSGVCERCRLRHLCTRAKMGRTLKRYRDQELLDRARRQSHSARACRDRKRRQWFQERNFGEAAVHHGFKRARWRGLQKQSIQDLVIAVLQNLKILIRKGGMGLNGLASLLPTLSGWLSRLAGSTPEPNFRTELDDFHFAA